MKAWRLQYIYLNWTPPFSQITRQILIIGQQNILHCASVNLCDISILFYLFALLSTLTYFAEHGTKGTKIIQSHCWSGYTIELKLLQFFLESRYMCSKLVLESGWPAKDVHWVPMTMSWFLLKCILNNSNHIPLYFWASTWRNSLTAVQEFSMIFWYEKNSSSVWGDVLFVC